MAAVLVNGVAVDEAAFPSREAAAAHELLRQRAITAGLAGEGARGAALEGAIEQLLERDVSARPPDEEECRRYYEAHLDEFTSGELVFARHILFQVTARVPLPAMRAKAETVLAQLAADPGSFDALARELSNCPSGKHGGQLGQLGRGETVPEFERALFNGSYLGLYPQLVKTRFGFHIVAVDRREAGRVLPFGAVRERIAARLGGRLEATALAQYVRRLAESADVQGVDLNGDRNNG